MKYNLGSVFFQRRCWPGKQLCEHKEWNFDKLAKKIYSNSEKNLARFRLKTLENCAVLPTVLEKICRKPKNNAPKMWNTNGKLFFFQKRFFPWKQSCGHLKCSSDRPNNKISRKHGKKCHIFDYKNLEANVILTTLLEQICRNLQEIPPKMWNTIGKVFSPKKMLPMKTKLWTRRGQFWWTGQ